MRSLVRGVRAGISAIAGNPLVLPEQLLREFPMLREVEWREGGLAPRVGGWFLGHRTVAGITLGTTVFLADSRAASVQLLLHEVAHARQYRRDKGFPLRYLWESLRHGYSRNRYEVEADQFAEGVLWSSTPRRPS